MGIFGPTNRQIYDLLQTLTEKVKHMSQSVSVELATIQTALDGIATSNAALSTDLVQIKDMIAQLQAGGSLSPADQASLDAIAAQVTQAQTDAQANADAAGALVPPPAPPP